MNMLELIEGIDGMKEPTIWLIEQCKGKNRCQYNFGNQERDDSVI
jgi:hypothetical protein